MSRKIYIISDTHFFHKEILDFENRKEGFEQQIIKRWNSVVGEDDIIIHLGDLTFGNMKDTLGIMKQLKGRKYLVRGNHDKRSMNAYLDLGFDFVGDSITFNNLFGRNIIFTHIPLDTIPEGYVNVHGHLHSGTHRENTLYGRNKGYYLYNPEKNGANLTPVTLKRLLEKPL